jgi:glyoxylase-like metal-dependent hydrolase (beta-lactamase superfamily II)
LTVRIGELELLPIDDGEIRLPPEFYVGLDLATHPEMVGADGKVPIPVGCYLLRTGDRTLLLDAGMGPAQTPWGQGGGLPIGLAAAGVAPADIDTVVCTHLHVDHVGWVVQDGTPYFPNATVRYGTADWETFVGAAEESDTTRRAFEALAAAGRLEPIDRDLVNLAPGVTARHTPGHTLGHYCLVLASGGERALLLGDAVECPLQLAEPDFYAMSDMDPALARRTREAVWAEVEGSATLVGGAHFPGLQFGRVLAGRGRRWFTPAG